jgi:CIC family chloride channel protein
MQITLVLNRFYVLALLVTGVAASVAALSCGLLYSYIWGLIEEAILKERSFIFAATLLSITLSFALIQYLSTIRAGNSDTHLMLETLHLRNGHLPAREAVVRAVASTTAISLGGAAGLEGPATVVGGGIGSTVARVFRLSSLNQKKMFLAGVAAGISAIFKAPLTAILFAIEIPYKRDVEKDAFAEVAVAASISYLLAVVVSGVSPIFYIPTISSIGLREIFHSIILGVVCGLYSALFVRLYNLADGLGRRAMARGGFGLLLLAGGLSLGAIGFLNLSSIGVGYKLISDLTKNIQQYSVLALLTLTILRLFTTTIFLNFGGSGGLLTPSVVEGALIGSLYSLLVLKMIEPIYVVVGMAAMLSGSHKIYLAPAAFIAETAGPNAIIPGLLASVCSFFTSGSQSLFPSQPSSKVYEEELALERVYNKVSKIASKAIDRIKASDIMSKEPHTLTGDESVEEALKKFESVPYRVLPIVDSSKRPIGVVRLEELVSASKKSLKLPVLATYAEKPVTISPSTPLKDIVSTMLKEGADHLYVVNERGELIGVIAKIDVVRRLIRYYTAY